MIRPAVQAEGDGKSERWFVGLVVVFAVGRGERERVLEVIGLSLRLG